MGNSSLHHVKDIRVVTMDKIIQTIQDENIEFSLYHFSEDYMQEQPWQATMELKGEGLKLKVEATGKEPMSVVTECHTRFMRMKANA